MRKFLPVLACTAAFALAACSQGEAPEQQAAPAETPVVIAKPTLSQPVRPEKPEILVKAQEEAANAPPLAEGETRQLDPAVAEAKSAYDAAMASYEEQSHAFTAQWKQYLVSVVTANMDGVKTTRPYMYFIPGGNDPGAAQDRANQLDNVKNVVARGVLPGNMMAFGGPDSKITADIMVEAFTDAQPGSFKDVRVLYIGDAADEQRVKDAVAPSGADLRFVEMK
ncbi:hypothetical protein [Dokdonella sp.]|uniref:hypothetical protein n=1 Tax=Dokdonella sp. TaxID=2291710 RepID=UPI0031BF1067|nr:hypothetical protein [Dokdonella sp.]